MRTLDLINKINVLLTRFATEVSGQSAMGFTDIHKASEKVDTSPKSVSVG